MPMAILFSFIVNSSQLAPSAEVCRSDLTADAVTSEFVIPRARFLLHRWLEPSYQVRMLASFDWTRTSDDSTIF